MKRSLLQKFRRIMAQAFKEGVSAVLFMRQGDELDVFFSHQGNMGVRYSFADEARGPLFHYLQNTALPFLRAEENEDGDPSLIVLGGTQKVVWTVAFKGQEAMELHPIAASKRRN